MPRSRGRGKLGDFLRIDDRSGFIHWASETQKEWNGAIVHRSLWEARHPQDFVRGRVDNLRVDDPRTVGDIGALPGVGPVITTIVAGSGGDNQRAAPMGALGQFAVGQADEGAFAADNAAGADSISVASVAGMSVGDRISVMLDSNNTFLTKIKSIESDTDTLILTGLLPGNASVGNVVVDFTATTSAALT